MIWIKKIKKILFFVPLFVNFAMRRTRKIIYFKDYFWEFFKLQPKKLRDKIESVLFLVRVAVIIPKKYFSKITDHEGLYEIHIEFEGNIYRIFCCFDEGNLIILFNGFQKKTRKTPKKEIDKAIRIRDEYFEQKRRS